MHSSTYVNPDASSHSAYYREQWHRKDIALDRCISQINNIFSENAYQEISEWCTTLRPYNGDKILASHEEIWFSESYKPEPETFVSFIQKGYPKDNHKLNALVFKLLERFAEELKLTGLHNIRVGIYQNFSKRKWWYESEAKHIMLMVFQENCFNPNTGESQLNIAENDAIGPFCPQAFLDLNTITPKTNYHSVSYPKNGAIVYDQLQGQIIYQHKVPELKLNNTTVIQMTVRDPDWKLPTSKNFYRFT